MKKFEYKFYNFKLSEIQKTEDWINQKSEIGFKIINIHYHTISEIEQVRIVMEREK